MQVEITLDVARSNFRKKQETIWIKQFERGNVHITAYIKDNGQPYDLTGKAVRLKLALPKNKVDVSEASVVAAENGAVELTLPDCVGSWPGQAAGYFEVVDGESFLEATENFAAWIERGIDIDGEQAEASVSLIDQLVAQLEEQKASMEDAANAFEERVESKVQEADEAIQSAANAAEDALAAKAATESATEDCIDAAEDARSAITPVSLEHDGVEYTNIRAYLRSHADGRMFTVKVPLYATSSGTDCVKADSNAGLACEPSTNTVAGRDDYAQFAAFWSLTCNGRVDEAGKPHVTAFKGEESFASDGSGGDVWQLAPVLYWRCSDADGYRCITISDTWHAGLEPQPGAKLPDGTLRPFMLYAKYALGKGPDGKMASVSGVPLWIRSVSQNSMVDMKNAKGAGYSGKTVADDWYVKVMLMMKYATKSSQEVFSGCSVYTKQANPSIAEEGVNRVVIPNADADALLVGSSMMLGTHTGDSTDRYTGYNFDVFDARRITRVEPYGSANKAVYFEGDPFDTATGYLLSTAPWHSGSCDMVKGLDGSPTSPKSGKEPFVLQGIECMVGAYELLSDIVMVAEELPDGTLREQVHRVYDSQKQAKSLTSDYVDTGYSLPISGSDGWSYACDFVNVGGLIAPSGTDATSTTGLGDAVYQNVSTSKGSREWLGVGDLFSWSHAGLSCVSGVVGLTWAYWYIAGRVSAIGRSAD